MGRNAREPVAFSYLLEIPKSNGVHTVLGFGCLPGSQKIIVFIVDLGGAGQQYQPPRIAAPKQLRTHTSGDGVRI